MQGDLLYGPQSTPWAATDTALDTAGYSWGYGRYSDTAGYSAGYSGIQRDTAGYSGIQRDTIKIYSRARVLINFLLALGALVRLVVTA